VLEPEDNDDGLEHFLDAPDDAEGDAQQQQQDDAQGRAPSASRAKSGPAAAAHQNGGLPNGRSAAGPAGTSGRQGTAQQQEEGYDMHKRWVLQALPWLHASLLAPCSTPGSLCFLKGFPRCTSPLVRSVPQ
jgi:hypothetical protein